MELKCTHTCRGLCGALEIAERKEREALNLYREYASGCDYPEVRDILERLIREREQAVTGLREKRLELEVKFSTLEDINDSFA